MSCPPPTSPRCAPGLPPQPSSTARRRPAGRRSSSRPTCRPVAGAELERLRALVEARLIAHAVFALATRPKTIIGPLFSRYEPGHAYGTHVDDALIGGVRTDVSFTLFLSAPESYDGGELDHRHRRRRGGLQAAGRQPRHLSGHDAASRGAGDARRAAGGGGLGAQLRPRSGPARAAVRPGDGAPPPVRPRGQDGGGRPARQVRRQPACACGATIEIMRRWRASVCAKTSRPVVPQFEFRLRAGCRRHPSRLLWNLRCLAKLQLTSRLQGSSTRRPGPRRMSSLTFSCLPWG